MKKQSIDTKYAPLIEKIETYFQNSTQSLHKARNEIKLITFKGEKLIVKSYKEPSFINKIAYKLGKPSKAKRAYNYALKIAEFTPSPIGYREFYENGLMKRSYFVTRYFEYDFTIYELLSNPNFLHRNTLLEEFAHFSKRLHDAKILHQDYSPGNILIQKHNQTYTFQIVDINRMSFQTLSQNDRLKNFAKLWATDSDLEMIIGYYSNNPNDRHIALKYSQAHKDKKNFKKKLKKILKR